MLGRASLRKTISAFSRFNFFTSPSEESLGRASLLRDCLVQTTSGTSFLSTNVSFPHFCWLHSNTNDGVSHQEIQECRYFPVTCLLNHTSAMFQLPCISFGVPHSRQMTSASIELKTDEGVVRFNFANSMAKEGRLQEKVNKVAKKVKKMSRKAKINELRFYRLKTKKKIKSPNPEVQIRYKLEKAKRKEAWLIEKLRKYELPKAPQETYDPEILTEEERFYLKRTGEKKKNYVPVGRRGVFGGVVLNMHLHWKKHETVKVVCRPCKPGQIHEYASELARLSKGIVIDIKPDNTIIFYRGKNYVQPDASAMSPPDTLSKAKALEKYRYEQSLEHTSQFIEKLEKELEEYHEYLARHKRTEPGN